MPTYLVFRDLPGVTRDQFVAAEHAVTDEADSARATGRAVRYVTGFFVPANAAGLCLFEGADAEEVAAVNQQAGVPFTSVVEAVEWHPPRRLEAYGMPIVAREGYARTAITTRARSSMSSRQPHAAGERSPPACPGSA